MLLILSNENGSTCVLLRKLVETSVAEPEPQGAASFGRSRSRNAPAPTMVLNMVRN
jgi:hypothetical protein